MWGTVVAPIGDGDPLDEDARGHYAAWAMSEKKPIALAAASVSPQAKKSNYPEPFASRVAGREKRRLGDAFGLANFGVNLTRLAPGAVSALRHSHAKLPVHNIWGRRDEHAPWEVELLFSEFDGDEWVHRRNGAIRGPVVSFGWRSDSGLMVVAPEIQLLYKSRSHRPKDSQDLASCLPHLSARQTSSLRAWIVLDSGASHPWMGLLG